MEREGIEPEMPEIEWGGYLVDYLWEVGPTEPAGMGSAKLSPPAIESWQRQTGITLQPWEFRLLRRLSAEYANEQAQASDPKRPPPFAESSDAARLHAAQLARKLAKFLD